MASYNDNAKICKAKTLTFPESHKPATAKKTGAR